MDNQKVITVPVETEAIRTEIDVKCGNDSLLKNVVPVSDEDTSDTENVIVKKSK